MVLLLALYFAHLAIAFVEAENGIPRPFTEIEQYTLLALHNMQRGEAEAKVEVDGGDVAIQQGNMECLTGKSADMVNYAQQLANNCPTELPNDSPFGLAIFRKDDGGRIATPNNYLRKARELLEQYRAPSNAFSTQQTDEEQNFVRQVYWYQGREIGCGRAICQNNTIIICAYTYKYVSPMWREFHNFPLKYYSRSCELTKKANLTLDDYVNENLTYMSEQPLLG
ncbi:hypothetical protein D918_08000 [Trichuris suis]|nr:hypothetical protein D918_08000 [Trichuris suis]